MEELKIVTLKRTVGNIIKGIIKTTLSPHPYAPERAVPLFPDQIGDRLLRNERELSMETIEVKLSKFTPSSRRW
jgi:hypothetical protein